MLNQNELNKFLSDEHTAFALDVVCKHLTQDGYYPATGIFEAAVNIVGELRYLLRD